MDISGYLKGVISITVVVITKIIAIAPSREEEPTSPNGLPSQVVSHTNFQDLQQVARSYQTYLIYCLGSFSSLIVFCSNSVRLYLSLLSLHRRHLQDDDEEEEVVFSLQQRRGGEEDEGEVWPNGNLVEVRFQRLFRLRSVFNCSIGLRSLSFGVGSVDIGLTKINIRFK